MYIDNIYINKVDVILCGMLFTFIFYIINYFTLSWQWKYISLTHVQIASFRITKYRFTNCIVKFSSQCWSFSLSSFCCSLFVSFLYNDRNLKFCKELLQRQFIWKWINFCLKRQRPSRWNVVRKGHCFSTINR